MYEIFVSHSTKDLQWAKYLRQFLTDAQAHVFVAEYDLSPGQSLSQEIIQRIDVSDLFILLWSRHSEMSHYVHAEVFHARAKQKKILPIMLQPGLRLPDLLADLKYLPVDQNPHGALEWLKGHISQSATQKAQSNLVALGLLAFIGWAFLKSE